VISRSVWSDATPDAPRSKYGIRRDEPGEVPDRMPTSAARIEAGRIGRIRSISDISLSIIKTFESRDGP
jgi:hypothetical protein